MTWVKGRSGNPSGRPKGRRDKITHAYLNDLHHVWRRKGRAALEAAAEAEPAAFVAIVSRLLPKDAQLTVTHELSQGFMRAIQAAQHTTSSEMPMIDVTPERVDDTSD